MTDYAPNPYGEHLDDWIDRMDAALYAAYGLMTPDIDAALDVCDLWDMGAEIDEIAEWLGLEGGER